MTRIDQIEDNVSGVSAEASYRENGVTLFNIRGLSESNSLRDGFCTYSYFTVRRLASQLFSERGPQRQCTATHRATRELTLDGLPSEDTEIRTSKCLNNLIKDEPVSQGLNATRA